jgi:hypothetical protein
MKRNKMKKIVALVAVLFSVIMPVQAHGADEKALVIIDAYFDSKVSGSNITCVVVSTNAPCTDVVTITSTLPGNVINHGNAMVEVAKLQNPNIKIIALRSAPASAKSVSDVTPAMFISALQWVDSNSQKVKAVSFSRYFNHATKPCMPTTSTPYTPETGNAAIQSLIASLDSKGIKVFASTGNTKGTKVDYPACILATNSVSSASLNKAGALVSNFAYNADTDYFADYSVLNYKSVVFGLIPQTTSSATAAVAAQYVGGTVLTKVNKVNP